MRMLRRRKRRKGKRMRMRMLRGRKTRMRRRGIAKREEIHGLSNEKKRG